MVNPSDENQLQQLVGSLVDEAFERQQQAIHQALEHRQQDDKFYQERNYLRRQTFKVFDTLRMMFERIIARFHQSDQDQLQLLALKTLPKQPTVFQLEYRELTLWFEIEDPGVIHLSFGNPTKQLHSRYNWILKGIVSGTQAANWYLHNMKEQVRPDLRLGSLVEVVQFAVRELIFNYDDYAGK